MQMAQMNNHLSGVETIFIPTSAEWSFLASKLVREVWRFGGDVSAFVPEPVAKALAIRYKEEGEEHVSDRFLEVDEEQPVEEIGIESVLNQLLDLIHAAKSMPLSSSVMVSRDEVISLSRPASRACPTSCARRVGCSGSARSSWPSAAARPRR